MIRLLSVQTAETFRKSVETCCLDISSEAARARRVSAQIHAGKQAAFTFYYTYCTSAFSDPDRCDGQHTECVCGPV